MSVIGLVLFLKSPPLARGGDFRKSTRPITLIDSMDNLSKPVHSDVVLNTTFTIIRTWGKNSFKKSSSEFFQRNNC